MHTKKNKSFFTKKSLFLQKMRPQEESFQQFLPRSSNSRWAQNALARTLPNQKKRNFQKPLLHNSLLTQPTIFHQQNLPQTPLNPITKSIIPFSHALPYHPHYYSPHWPLPSFNHLLMFFSLLSRFLESIHHVLNSPKLQPSQSFPSSPSSPV